jgi:hypothetical protein
MITLSSPVERSDNRVQRAGYASPLTKSKEDANADHY